MKKNLLILSIPLLISTTVILNNKEVDASTSDSNNFQMRSIIGDDTRGRLTNTTLVPYNSTVFVEAHGRVGSGVVIGKNTVLTAAHVVKHIINNPNKGTNFVIPGRNGSDCPYGKFEIKSVHIPQSYLDNPTADQDIAVLTIQPKNNRAIGEYIIPRTIKLTNSVIIGANLQMLGYPADKPWGTMWMCYGSILKETNNLIYYDMDTFKGQSGAPVYNYANELVAVHTTGNENGNFGTKINSEHYKFISDVSAIANAPANAPLDAPELQVKDRTIARGTHWLAESNFLAGKDSRGQAIDFTNIKVTGTVDTNKVGTYNVMYSYIDPKLKLEGRKQATITVANAPVIQTKNSTIAKGAKWTPQENFTSAKDSSEKEGKFNEVKVTGTVDTNKVGTYEGIKQTSQDTIVYHLIYRLYNPNTGEHFYTQSAFERDTLVKDGWNNEGTSWSSPNKGTAVYRVYNPNAKGGDHYYTSSKYEADSLVKTGWEWDNGAKPVFYSGGKTPVYVSFNPNATASGSHNYTSSSFEQQSLLKNGWKFGKVQFYGK